MPAPSSRFIPTPEQKVAIEHRDGPMLVSAGAGTGKTTVLVQRVAHLIDSGHARPDEIVLITYTLNAAASMREKLAQLIKPLWARDVVTCTFHDWCLELLNQHGHGFQVIEEDDLWIHLQRMHREQRLPLERFVKAASPGAFIDALLRFYVRCTDELVNAARYAAYVEQLAKDPDAALPRIGGEKEELDRDEVIARCREIAAVFRTTEDELAQRGWGTFGHMVLGAVELLQRDPEVLAKAQASARFLLLDEFQDANMAQIELATLLAGKEQNIFAVGDPDQAIYKFRGACSATFEEFVRRFPRTKRASLVLNRRSRTPILECAWEVIRANPEAMSDATAAEWKRRKLQSARDEGAPAGTKPARKVEVACGYKDDEAAFIAQQIEERQRTLRCTCAGEKHRQGWCNFAVLYRYHSQREAVVRELGGRNVPFVVKGSGVGDTTAVRDALAALRAVAHPGDPLSMFRVAALPKFAVDPATLRDEMALTKDTSLAAALAKAPGGDAVLRALAAARGSIDPQKTSAAEALQVAVATFGLPAAEELKVLTQFVANWERKPISGERTLADLLDYLHWHEEHVREIGLPEDRGDDRVQDAVRLMTVHGAKGLEFREMYLLRAGSFPGKFNPPLFDVPPELRSRLSQAEDNKELHAEEERRLLYVAMTRGGDTLTLCAAPGRGRDKTPSGILRGLLGMPALQPFIEMRMIAPTGLTLAAVAAPATPLAEWMQLPVAPALAHAALSASAIENYEQCPLRFKLEKDWRLRAKPTAALHHGGAMHEALKYWSEGAMQGTPPHADQVVQSFLAALDAHPIEEALQDQLFRRQGERQLRAFVAARAAEPLPQVIAAEQTFAIEIGGIRVRGRLDRLDRLADGSVAVIDYKTGKPKDQKKADDSLQLALYAIAARRLGLEARELIFYNLENNAAVVSTRAPEDLAAVEAKVVEVAQRIAAGDFAPAPEYRKCGACPYRAVCPETEDQPLSEIANAVAAPN